MINIYISFCLFTFIFIFTIWVFLYHRKKCGFKLINIISLLLVSIGEVLEIISLYMILNPGYFSLSWFLLLLGFLFLLSPYVWFRKWYIEFLLYKFNKKPNIKIISIKGRSIDIINSFLSIVSAFIYIMIIWAIVKSLELF